MSSSMGISMVGISIVTLSTSTDAAAAARTPAADDENEVKEEFHLKEDEHEAGRRLRKL